MKRRSLSHRVAFVFWAGSVLLWWLWKEAYPYLNWPFAMFFLSGIVRIFAKIQEFEMKKDIHPEYREVLFHDTSVDKYWLIRSTMQSDQTKEWTDGNTYPYCPLDVSSASHPFYTGEQRLIDTGGRVERFRKRFGNTSKSSPSKEETPSE